MTTDIEFRQLSDVVDEALRPVRKVYRQYVLDSAQEIINDNPDENLDALYNIAGDYADNEWTIYTRNAYLVLLCSSAPDAGDDIFDGFIGNNLDTTVATFAACALAQDIRDAIDTLMLKART